jgi:hypothetical protein
MSIDTCAATSNAEAQVHHVLILNGWEPVDDLPIQRWIDPVTERIYSWLRAMDLVQRRVGNRGVQT